MFNIQALVFIYKCYILGTSQVNGAFLKSSYCTMTSLVVLFSYQIISNILKILSKKLYYDFD